MSEYLWFEEEERERVYYCILWFAQKHDFACLLRCLIIDTKPTTVAIFVSVYICAVCSAIFSFSSHDCQYGNHENAKTY